VGDGRAKNIACKAEMRNSSAVGDLEGMKHFGDLDIYEGKN
jgi:hypothetical protein